VDPPSNVLNFLEIKMNPTDVLDETIFSNSGEKNANLTDHQNTQIT